MKAFLLVRGVSGVLALSGEAHSLADSWGGEGGRGGEGRGGGGRGGEGRGGRGREWEGRS